MRSSGRDEGPKQEGRQEGLSPRAEPIVSPPLLIKWQVFASLKKWQGKKKSKLFHALQAHKMRIQQPAEAASIGGGLE